MFEAAPRRSGVVRGALVVTFYVGLTLVFFKPVVLDNATFSTVGAVQRVYLPWQVTNENDRAFFPQSDQAQSFYPRQVFVDRAVEAGELPAWDPYTFAGHPYLSNGGNSFFYPPRQAVTWAAGPALAHDLYLMFHMAFAGCAAFVLLRQLRFSTAGSLLGGLAWMWNPFFLAWAQLELLPPIMAWFPLAIALVNRADERSSWPSRLGAGGACGLMILGGSLDLALAATGVTVTYAGALEARRVWQARARSGWLRPAASSAATLSALPAVALGLGAPAIVPFALLSPRFARTPMPYETFVSHVAVPLSSFGRIWWHPDFPITVPIMHSLTFVGTPLAVLALIGIVQRRRGTGMARALLLGSVLVLGRTPLVPVLDALTDSYRFLSLGRFMYGWVLGMVILAVAGFDRLAGAIQGTTRPAASGLVADPLDLARTRGWRRPGREWAALFLFGIASVATAAQLGRYGRAINADFTPRDRSWLFPETPAIDALLARQTVPAADRNLPLTRPDLQPLPDSSIPLVFPFESAAGYDSALPSTIVGLWRVVMGETPDQVAEAGLASGLVAAFRTDRTRFDLLPRVGVTSVLGPNDLEDEPGWDEAGRRDRGLATVYDGRDADLLEVIDPAPRAYVVHDADYELDPNKALARFTDPSFPWRTTVLLDGAPRATRNGQPGEIAPGDLDPATITEHDLTEVSVEVSTDAPGFLVLLDSFDDGWSATIEGEPVEVLRANASFRAVEVPAGSSTVVFRYITPGLQAGLVLALVTLAGVTMSIAVTVRTRRRREPELSEGSP